MKLTKENIVNRINRLSASTPVKWDDINVDLDMAINEINSYLSTRFPPITEILDDYCSPEKTYTYRSSGKDVNFFPEKYFHSIVIPYVISQILAREEEFSAIYSKNTMQYQESLFVMVRDELSNVPNIFISAPKGVFFSNPDPLFKEDPEKYFNREIKVEDPRVMVQYSWGNFAALLPNSVSPFVEKPLPIDKNSYDLNSSFLPVRMSGNDYETLIVDENKRVLGYFLGWSLSPENDPSKIIDGYITLDEDKTFYGVFDLDVYGIVYNGNGGTVHNWKPKYVVPDGIFPKEIIPLSGTATRLGYEFKGFDPGHHVLEERDETEDVLPEDDLVFNAFWERKVYSITYVCETGTPREPSEYTYGQRIELQPPSIEPGEEDEFIGWWDNKEFIGDRVTRIYETDHGNKTFYANYNKNQCVITFESGIRKVEILRAKGSRINIPTAGTVGFTSEFFEKADDTEGLHWSYEFKHFKNDNEELLTSLTNATKNETYRAEFKAIPIMGNLTISYFSDDEIEQNKIIKYQKGKTIDLIDVFNILAEEDKDTYLDSGINYYINGFIVDGENLTLENSFKFDDITEITALYGQESFTVELYQTESSEDFIETKVFSTDVSVDSVKVWCASQEGILGEAGEPSEWLNDFYDQGTSLAWETIPDMGSTKKLYPHYDSTKNNLFFKTLTVYDHPQENSKENMTKSFEYKIGTTIVLATDIIEPTEENDYLYNQIKSLHEDADLDGEDLTEITLNRNEVIYAEVESKLQLTVIFEIDDESNTEEVEIYPFMFEEGEYQLSLDEKAFNPDPDNKIQTGWALKTDEEQKLSGSYTIEETEDDDITFVPYFENLKGFKVTFEFEELGNDLEVDFTLDGNITIEKEYDVSKQNTTQFPFSSYTSLKNEIKSKLEDYMKSINFDDFYYKIFKGYEAFDCFCGYKIYLNGSLIKNYFFDDYEEKEISINLEEAETTEKEYTIKVLLRRDFNTYGRVTLKKCIYLDYAEDILYQIDTEFGPDQQQDINFFSQDGPRYTGDINYWYLHHKNGVFNISEFTFFVKKGDEFYYDLLGIKGFPEINLLDFEYRKINFHGDDDKIKDNTTFDDAVQTVYLKYTGY